MTKNSTKSKNQYSMPGKLWKLLKKHLPKEPKQKGEVVHGSTIGMFWMASGMCYGQDANGNPSKRMVQCFQQRFA